MSSTIVNTNEAQKAMNALQAFHDHLCNGNKVECQLRHGLSDVIIKLVESGFPEPSRPKAKRKHMQHSPVSELPHGDPLGPNSGGGGDES